MKYAKKLSEKEWDSVWEVLELVQLRAINNREWLEMVETHSHIFTPEFLEKRYKPLKKKKIYPKGMPFKLNGPYDL